MPIYKNGYIVYCENCRRNFTEENLQDVKTTLDRYNWSYRINKHNVALYNQEDQFKDIVCSDCQVDIDQ